jgi:hypothetical protein
LKDEERKTGLRKGKGKKTEWMKRKEKKMSSKEEESNSELLRKEKKKKTICDGKRRGE